jgi:polyferredoxin
MATDSRAVSAPRSVGRSLLLTLPIALWALLMFSQAFMQPGRSAKIAAVLTMVFMVVLFYKMVRTSSTYRWRRWFFVALGFLFPVGFIYNMVIARGTMGIPVEEMIAGRTPFCFLPIPMLLLPAALFKTIAFPGSIVGSSHGIASMIGLWLALTVVVGKGWCSYACFFGGIEEGFSCVSKRPKLRKLDPRWRYGPWAVLLAMALLSLALFEPAYCTWLCPFKAVTEYVEARNLVGLIQNGIFLTIFLGLVVVLPILTRKRTQCAFFCPFGAFQSIFNKTSIFEVKIDRSRCSDCMSCQTKCPTLSLSKESVAKGETLMSCMKCGACVDACPKQAAVWHIKGTPVSVKPERARLMFLYAAWAMAIMFGGSIIAGSVSTILHFFI